VLENLVEDLGRRQPPAQLLRDRGDDRIVDLLQPPVGRHDLGDRTALDLLQVGAEASNVVRQPLAGLQVEQLAGDPLGGQLDVVGALPVGQSRVLLAGLRVDQVRLQRARVVPVQRVGQRAVPPEEPGQVQPDEQFDQRVQQAVDGLDAARVGEDRAVRRRVGEEPGDQDRVAVLLAGLRLVQVDRDPDHLDGRDVQVGQRSQHLVLAPRQPFTQLLERVQGAVVVHEPNHVPRDAPLADLDQPVVPPLRQRHGPRQGQQPGRAVGRGSEDEPHVDSSPASPAGPASGPSRAGRATCWRR